MHDWERIWRYAEGYFERSNRTEFPTVRRVALALKLRQSQVMEEIEGDPEGCVMTTGYYSAGEAIGDRFVETFERTP